MKEILKEAEIFLYMIMYDACKKDRMHNGIRIEMYSAFLAGAWGKLEELVIQYIARLKDKEEGLLKECYGKRAHLAHIPKIKRLMMEEFILPLTKAEKRGGLLISSEDKNQWREAIDIYKKYADAPMKALATHKGLFEEWRKLSSKECLTS